MDPFAFSEKTMEYLEKNGLYERKFRQPEFGAG